MRTLVSTPRAPEPAVGRCLHCGNTAMRGDFCCPGCEAVFAILKQSGLSQYYKRKASGFQLKHAEPVEIHPSDYTAWNSACGESPELYIDGVHCSACVWLIEKLPEVMPNEVVSARLDLSKSTLRVQLRASGRISEVADRLASWGYRPELLKSEADGEQLQNQENRRRLIDLGIAGALAGNVMLMSIPLYSGVGGSFERAFEWISAALSVPSLFYCGRSFFSNVYRAVRSGVFSIDLPIVLALVAAFGFSVVNLVRGDHSLYFDSMTALVFLLLASRYALARLRQLGLGQSAFRAWMLKDSVLKIGERMDLVESGAIDVDVKVVSGRGFISQAFLTGESAPVLVVAGDVIYAGSRWLGPESGNASVRVEVIATGEQTRLARILRDIDRLAERGYSRFERQNERRAFWLVNSVLAVAVGVLVYFGMRGEWETALVRSISLLIVTCPCAFALAAPLTLSLGLKKAIEQGVVIRDPDFFEKLLKVQDVFFDKTGTLTTGQLNVVVDAVPHRYRPILRAIVARSSHPVSRALSRFLGDGETVVLNHYREIAGFGIEASANGQRYGLFRGAELQAEMTTVDFLVDDEFVGRYQFSDQLREEARELVAQFVQSGAAVHILSGDQTAAVQSVARSLNVSESGVYSRLTPEEKAQKIEQQRTDKRLTLMVGDGLNDAIALKCADLSIAVRGGLEHSLKISDAYVLSSGLQPILAVRDLSTRVRTILTRNFIFSTSYNVLSGSLAVLGLMSPLLAAVLMPLSAATAFTATLIGFRNRKMEGAWK